MKFGKIWEFNLAVVSDGCSQCSVKDLTSHILKDYSLTGAQVQMFSFGQFSVNLDFSHRNFFSFLFAIPNLLLCSNCGNIIKKRVEGAGYNG